MRKMAWVAAAAIVLCGTLASAGEAAKAAEQVAPELTVAGWLGSSVGLEDFKGQVTALVFFNDSRA